MTVQTSLKVSTISYAIVYVKKAEKAVPFYRDVLGAKVKMESPDWVEFDMGATTLALHSEDKPLTRGTSTVIVFPVKDVHEAAEALKAAGAKIVEGPQQVCETPTGIGYSVEFEDPDGNRLSIYSEKSK